MACLSSDALIAQIYDWPKLNKARRAQKYAEQNVLAGGVSCVSCVSFAAASGMAVSRYRICNDGGSTDFLFHFRRLTK